MPTTEEVLAERQTAEKQSVEPKAQITTVQQVLRLAAAKDRFRNSAAAAAIRLEGSRFVGGELQPCRLTGSSDEVLAVWWLVQIHNANYYFSPTHHRVLHFGTFDKYDPEEHKILRGDIEHYEIEELNAFSDALDKLAVAP